MFDGNSSVERWFRDLIRSSFAYANISGRQWKGALTLNYQPAFLAYNSVTDSDVTGNSTVATVNFDTEVFDQGSNFASNTFTAPVKGKYRFSVNVQGRELTNATSIVMYLQTSNRQILLVQDLSGTIAGSGTKTFGGGVITDMDAGDTAYVTFQATGIGADTADIFGHATIVATFFSGELVC